MSREVKVGNEWVRVAGRGKAEYGASHYQTGTVGNPEITNGKSSGFYKSLQVTFDETMPDTDYQVTLATVGSYWAEVDVAVGTRTTTGFTLLFKYTHGTAEPATLTIAENSFQVKWQAFKLYSDKEYDGLLDDVAEMKTIKDITSSSTISASVNPNCIKVVRCGNVVDVSMSYAASNVLVDLPAGATGQIIGGLPDGASITSGDFIGGDTQGKYYMLYFQNGAVRPRQVISAGSVLTFHFTYITSD